MHGSGRKENTRKITTKSKEADITAFFNTPATSIQQTFIFHQVRLRRTKLLLDVALNETTIVY